MPDTTRTGPKDVLAVLAREMRAIARGGLLPAEVARRRSQLDATFGLASVLAAGADPLAQAGALVDLVVQAARTLPAGARAEMAMALLGVEHRHRDAPYERRRALAVGIWDPGEAKSDESFTRRMLPRICSDLASAMLAIDGRVDESEHALVRGAAPLEEQRASSGLTRLAITAETWLTSSRDRPLKSEWTYRDRAVRDGVKSTRLFRRSDLRFIEPITDSVAHVAPLGVDENASTAWRVAFERPLVQGEEIEWGTRSIYPPGGGHPMSWLAVSVSHHESAGRIQRASFRVHFDERYPPRRVAKFVTPKGSLPDIAGPITAVPMLKHAEARADFEMLESWKTYGIRWWR